LAFLLFLYVQSSQRRLREHNYIFCVTAAVENNDNPVGDSDHPMQIDNSANDSNANLENDSRMVDGVADENENDDNLVDKSVHIMPRDNTVNDPNANLDNEKQTNIIMSSVDAYTNRMNSTNWSTTELSNTEYNQDNL